MADNKVLFVSDLDGTLMRSDISLSDFTVRTINGLVENGLNFTYATARSVESARPIAGGLNLKLPVITRNGAVLADNNTGRHIEKAVFTSDEVQLLKDMLEELPLCGFVSCFTGEKMIKTYMAGEHTEAFQGYIDYYKDDPVMVSKNTVEEMFCGEPGYVTLMGEKEYIRPIYEKVKTYQGWESLFQKDTYREEYWLEICPQNCTKAKTILKLKERYGFEKLVVFGDALNDLPMFKIADEAYAVSNALDVVKEAATKVIGSNDEDAVAVFLSEIAEKQLM